MNTTPATAARRGGNRRAIRPASSEPAAMQKVNGASSSALVPLTRSESTRSATTVGTLTMPTISADPSSRFATMPAVKLRSRNRRTGRSGVAVRRCHTTSATVQTAATMSSGALYWANGLGVPPRARSPLSLAVPSSLPEDKATLSDVRMTERSRTPSRSS
jgi:hypothetical protein